MATAGKVLCFSHDGVSTWGDFAAAVDAFAPALDGVSHVCNMLPDRYDFMVALAASLRAGRPTVLPSHVAREAVAAALGDAEAPLILQAAPERAEPAPGLGDDAVCALYRELCGSGTQIGTFTSGTTRTPRRHAKTWEILAAGAAITRTILQGLGLEPGRTALIGTTPHQHMYGLEATIFAALAHGYATFRGTPFYAADLEAAHDAARRAGFDDIALITSPAHLRYLSGAIGACSHLRAVISATAPLPLTLAREVEAQHENLRVAEIYGSTETGSMALRRTADGPLWSLDAGFALERGEAGWRASAPHLPEPVPLGDEFALAPDGRFSLEGRVGDMVSVNGKRTSLAALNLILHDAPGLTDGVVLHQPGEGGDRLAIAAVRDAASEMSDDALRVAIRKHFHSHCDPVFAARRIVFVDALPRSATGKISAAELGRLARAVGWS